MKALVSEFELSNVTAEKLFFPLRNLIVCEQDFFDNCDIFWAHRILCN